MTVRSSWARTAPVSRVCTSRPPATLLYSSNCVTGKDRSPVIEHAYVVPRRQHRLGLLRDAWRQDHLDELLFEDRARGRRIQFAIEGDDAAIGGGRVGAVGERIGVRDAAAAGGAAGIGMLDNDATRGIELTHAFQRRIAIGDVVERQFPPLNLPRLRDGCADGARVGVERGLLMRIFAVAQVDVLSKGQIQVVGKGRRRIRRSRR